MRKILSLILVCLIAITIFSGCGASDPDSLNSDELTPASSVSLGEDQASELKDKTPVRLYFISEQGNMLSPETRYISNEDAAKGSADFATAVLKELISGPAQGSLLKATIPQGTTVHSGVTIKDGVAVVDLSKEFVDKHPGGKKSEQLTLYSIVNTLTEITDIKTVQFEIEGKVKKEFKGNYQIDMAYPRSAYLNTTQEIEKDVVKLEGDSVNNNSNTNDNKNNNNNNKSNENKGNDNKINDNNTNDQNQQGASGEKDQKTNADIVDGELLE